MNNKKEETKEVEEMFRSSSMEGLLIKVPAEMQDHEKRKTKSFPGSPEESRDQRLCNETGMYQFD